VLQALLHCYGYIVLLITDEFLLTMEDILRWLFFTAAAMAWACSYLSLASLAWS